MVKKMDELKDDDNFVGLFTKEEKIEYGLNTARAVGLEQGIEQGIEKKTKEDAINLYKKGISKDIIIDALNITDEKLEYYLNDEN